MEQRNLRADDDLYVEALIGGRCNRKSQMDSTKKDAKSTANPASLELGSSASGSPVAFDIERRRELRTPHTAVLGMPYGEGMNSGFEEATLTDCSPRGVGLVLERPLRPGIHLFLKLKLSTVALVVYSVKHCRSTEGGYRIGADFCGVIGSDADRASSAEVVLAALLAAK
jgi:hypothetical protein